MYQFDFHHVVVHKITVRDANMCLARVPDTQIISCQPVSHTKSYSHYYMSHLYFIVDIQEYLCSQYLLLVYVYDSQMVRNIS
jgi:hypothetical protein